MSLLHNIWELYISKICCSQCCLYFGVLLLIFIDMYWLLLLIIYYIQNLEKDVICDMPVLSIQYIAVVVLVLLVADDDNFEVAKLL